MERHETECPNGNGTMKNSIFSLASHAQRSRYATSGFVEADRVRYAGMVRTGGGDCNFRVAVGLGEQERAEWQWQREQYNNVSFCCVLCGARSEGVKSVGKASTMV